MSKPDGNDVNSSVAYGLITALQTGNPFRDSLTATIIHPMMAAAQNIVNHVSPTVKQMGNGVWRLGRTEFVRTITYEKTFTCWGDAKEGTNAQNKILQKSIMLYISEKNLLSQSDYADLKLMPLGKEASSGSRWNRQFGTTAKHLEQYNVYTSLSSDEWLEIEPELRLKVRDSENSPENEEEEGGDKHSIVFELRCSAADGKGRINDFIEKAFAWYTELQESQLDKARYMYIMQGSKSSEEDEDEEDKGGARYKRYKLVGNKTFNSLFLPDKSSLMRLLDQFMNREVHPPAASLCSRRDQQSATASNLALIRELSASVFRASSRFQDSPISWDYCCTGPLVRNQLNEGTPSVAQLSGGLTGTGKTSMIKALAQYTGRSIVNVPLGRIKTNQELMDCMFDLKFNVAGQDMPIQMGFSKLIFVLEDVDAATSVVHKRASGGMAILLRPCPDHLCRAGESGKDNTFDDDNENEEEGVDSVDMMKHMLNEMMMMQAMNSSTSMSDPLMKGAGGMKSFELDKTDALDLSGVLNVLDGVVDCPERILVMTTNHPEKLDPALIRPGRINLKLHLNYMQAPEMLQMLAHYFGELTPAQHSSAKAAFLEATTHGVQFTPAQLEQLCAEADQVEDFVSSVDSSYQVDLESIGEE